MKTVAIVQARMGSTRLPGKVLADLCGQPMLQRMLARVQCAKRLDEVMVATTLNSSDDPIAKLCGLLRVPVFRGDESDVLTRYDAAATDSGADVVVRLTADCPMIEPALIDQAVGLFNSGNWDYVSNCSVRTYPDGLDVEVCGRVALSRAAREAKDPWLREHVTPYISGISPERGSGAFKVEHLVFAADFSHIRWTVDTAEDLARIRRLFAALPDNFTWLKALALATKEPELLGVSL